MSLGLKFMNIKQNKFIKLYRNLSIRKKAVLWFTICNFFQKSISFITVPIFTRIMSPSEYGVFSVYQSWFLIVNIFLTFNLQSGVYNNGLMKYDRDNFTKSMIVLSNIITLFWFFVFIISRSLWENYFGLSFVFIFSMFVDSFFGVIVQFWTARQRFEYNYKIMTFVTCMLTFISAFTCIIFVIFASKKAEVRVVTMVCVNAVFGIVIYLHEIKKAKLFNFLEYCKYALKFNIPLLPHYLSLIVLQQSDRLFIARICGDGKAAIYSIAYTVGTIMQFIINAITSAITPSIYNSIKEKKMDQLSKLSIKLLFLVGILCLGIVLLGPEIISIFAPGEYAEAIWVIPPVAISVFFMFFYNFFTIVEFYYEKTTYVMVASVAGAVLNIFLNYIFILRYGYIAAAYTTLVCYILFALLHYLLSCKLLRDIGYLKIFNNKMIFQLCISILSVNLLSLLLYYYIIFRYITITLLIVVGLIKKSEIIDFLKKIFDLKQN